MKDKKLPFGIKHRPKLANTKSVLCDVSDHLGESTVMVDTWWSGEGFTVHVHAKDGKREIDFSWSEWDALRLCLKEIKDSQ